MTDDIFFATITELNGKLKAREFSAVELTKAFAERLQAIGPRYNALALPLTKSALKSAKDVDGDLKRERFRGPLQGVPFGAKDLLSVAGEITTWGAKPYAQQKFDYTATALTKLDKAGAVLIGKLAMVELAGGGGYRITGASYFGPGKTPWNTDYWSGGSSSGSGSAVAAGLVPYALGSETSGSILTPAAFCGVTGLRPTYGLVSRYGAMALSWTMDKVGPLCRSADDCGHVLAAIAGKDEKDPASAGKSFYYTPEYHREWKTIRVGYAPIDFSEWADPSARPAFEQALAVLRRTGFTLVETKLPDFPYGALTGTVIAAEGASIFEPLVASGEVDQLADPKQAAGFRAALGIPAKDYLRAMRIRTLVKQEFHRLFSDIDVLVAPSRYGPAPNISDPLDARGPEVPKERSLGMTGLIPAGNLVGMPALSLPCGFANGLPVAIQLAGLPFSENLLLSIGREFQSRTDWHRRRPPVAAPLISG
ncbi:MAG: amidase [Acidobacteriota bacterium]|nr:amidase [Acidobacteriota bacterium]